MVCNCKYDLTKLILTGIRNNDLYESEITNALHGMKEIVQITRDKVFHSIVIIIVVFETI